MITNTVVLTIGAGMHIVWYDLSKTATCGSVMCSWPSYNIIERCVAALSGGRLQCASALLVLLGPGRLHGCTF